ncbi:MAG: methyltransferase domain-containing protein [Ignavibacteriaceae bacterium]|nr:methyltransferase domain-containing protein [Ignavibacteriaceae bacterium]
MNESEIKLKLSYVIGLKPVVLKELKQLNFEILDAVDDSVYVSFSKNIISEIKHLRSVARAYVVLHSDKYHPSYISNHKSILGSLVDIVINDDKKIFNSFKINCAGSDSPEVRSISKYIQETYDLKESEEADLKIHIIKPDDIWEIGIQITPRPLSVRDYKVVNMSGAMDSTIAYAVNSFCNLEKATTYLNIFSGSATLLIEAGLSFSNLEKLVGFDNEKKHLSLSVQNVKKAGLIKKIQIKEADIFDKPDFGKFDAIATDLPFGMLISKNENLEKLYKAFVEYCEEKLEPSGRLVVYTSEHELIESILLKSRFKIIQSLQLKLITNANAYLKPKIIVCEFKN